MELTEEQLAHLTRVVDEAGKEENQIAIEQLTQVLANICGAFAPETGEAVIVMKPVNALSIVAELIYRRRKDSGRCN